MKEIEIAIERTRERLHNMISMSEQLTSKDIIQLSQQLDTLIKVYYC